LLFQKETSPLQLELSQLPVIRVSDRPYKCNYPGCKKAYMWKQHLKRHKQHAHSPPKYHCPIPECNKVFRWKDDHTITSNMSTTSTSPNDYHAQNPIVTVRSKIQKISEIIFDTYTPIQYAKNVLIPIVTEHTSVKAD